MNGQSLQQMNILLEIPAIGLAHDGMDRRDVAAKKGVQHDRHLSGVRIVSVRGTLAPIRRDFRRELVDVVIQQVSEQVGADRAGPLERSGTGGGGHPQRELPLDRRRVRADPDRFASAAFYLDRLAAPQPPHVLDTAEQRLVAIAVPCGFNAKSSGFQPDANDIPTRPFERLSTTDHSSVSRSGLCSGMTTLPAMRRTREVSRAMAACSVAGLG